MSFSQPNSPDPTAVSNTQQAYNQQAATAQNKTNSYNQVNPFGSQTYYNDPNSPSGMGLNTQLSAPLQSLFNTQTGTLNNAAQNSAGMYGSPYDLQAQTGQTASLLNSWNKQYLDPIFQQQQSNKDAQLQNQGLAPGSQAYNNAQNLLARNQGDVTNQYLAQNEPAAFAQSLAQYQLPLQTMAALKGTIPGSPTFANTPTSQIAPPNYAAAAQANFQNQQNQFQNTIGDIGQVAGLVAAPFTGGLSMLPGMFAGFGQSGNGVSGSAGGWNAANPFGGGSGGAIY